LNCGAVAARLAMEDSALLRESLINLTGASQRVVKQKL